MTLFQAMKMGFGFYLGVLLSQAIVQFTISLIASLTTHQGSL